MSLIPNGIIFPAYYHFPRIPSCTPAAFTRLDVVGIGMRNPLKKYRRNKNEKGAV
jgi:hypothetical protein